MMWFDKASQILAVLLGRGFISVLLAIFGYEFAIHAIRRSLADPTLAPAISSVPRLALWAVPGATAVAFGSLPWVIPFLPVLRWRHRDPEKSDADSN
jgi:hypothetical protein